MTRHIVAIGQLPPPLNGFSFATKSMIALLSEANSVTVANIAPPFGKLSLLKHPVRFARVIGACLQLFRDRKRVSTPLIWRSSAIAMASLASVALVGMSTRGLEFRIAPENRSLAAMADTLDVNRTLPRTLNTWPETLTRTFTRTREPPRR